MSVRPLDFLPGRGSDGELGVVGRSRGWTGMAENERRGSRVMRVRRGRQLRGKK